MSTTPQIYFNPWDPEFRANPYPYYGCWPDHRQ